MTRLARAWHVLVALPALAGCGELSSSLDTVAAVAFSLDTARLFLGSTLQLEAHALDAAGDTVADAEMHWSSNNPQVVLVSPDGVARAVGVGKTSITAESGGRSAAIPTEVTARFVTVSAGLAHTCAVTDQGYTACWGSNSWGRLGSELAFSSTFPVLAEGAGSGAATAYAGGFHSCALLAGGAAFCWGANWAGQLGAGTSDGLRHAAPASVLGGVSWTAFSLGDSHTCALSDDQRIYCWGNNDFGQLGPGGSTEFCSSAQVECSTAPREVAPGLRFTAVSAGRVHTCGITTEGDALCWGGNIAGQLGHGTDTSATNPTPVTGGLKFESISSSPLHTCGLTMDGEAYCWGLNSRGQLGDGSTTRASAPVPVTGGLRFTTLATGGAHTCALDAQGAAYCWGANLNGQLGSAQPDVSTVPLAVATSLRFRTISAGEAHTCGLSTDDVLYCWGLNFDGQVGAGLSGDGLTRSIRQPTRVLGQPD
ncbi:MAG: hypothetical protein ACE5PT_11670 [Gemmatimonadales bacterium]